MESAYRSISTKVSPRAFECINRICKKKGIAVYELLQLVIDTLVRYMDDQHNLSQEMEEAMSIFEHLEGWKNAYNHAAYCETAEVGEATYFVQDGGKTKLNGVRAVHIERPFMGMWTETNNTQIILERTINLIFPEMYKRLRVVGADLGTDSVLKTLNTLIGEHIREQDLADLRKDFEDANNTPWGTKMPDAPYKRVMFKGVDSIDRQQMRIDYETQQDLCLDNE